VPGGPGLEPGVLAAGSLEQRIRCEQATVRSPWVDKDRCVACETCVDLRPEVFRLTDDSLAEVHDPKAAGEDAIQEVIELCPVGCILWIDD
jgi:ferredoxin